MLNIVCVCHNGMGTSMLLKINVTNICNRNGIESSVEACSHGEALSFLVNANVVITSPEIVEMLPPTDAKIIATTNMLNVSEVEKLLVDCVKANFPDELQ